MLVRIGQVGVLLKLVLVVELHLAKLVGRELAAGVFRFLGLAPDFRRLFGQLDARRVLFPQRQLVRAQVDLDGVAERRDLAHGDDGAGREAHVDKAALDGGLVAADGDDHAALSGPEILQCRHFLFLPESMTSLTFSSKSPARKRAVRFYPVIMSATR